MNKLIAKSNSTTTAKTSHSVDTVAILQSDTVQVIATPVRKKHFYWSKVDNAVSHDTTLCKTACELYHILVAAAEDHPTYVIISVRDLAERLGRAISTTRKHLATLEERGIIVREFRKDKRSRYSNKETLYHIRGRLAPCYRDSEFSGPPEEETKNRRGVADFRVGESEIQSRIKEENQIQNQTLRRGDSEERLTPNYVEEDSGEVLSESPCQNDTSNKTPSQSKAECGLAVPTAEALKEPPKPLLSGLNDSLETTNNNEETAGAETQTLQSGLNEGTTPLTAEKHNKKPKTPKGKPQKPQSRHDEVEDQNPPKLVIPDNVPDIMKATAEHFLLTFGRVRMSTNEGDLLRKLSFIHTPARINRAIDEAAERLSSNGRPLKFNAFGYIYKMLKDQNSLSGAGKKSRKRNKKGKKCAPEKASVQLAVKEQREQPEAVSVAEIDSVQLEAEKQRVAEAEKVIAEFKPAVTEQLPAAWLEFLERLAAKNQEVWDSYEASLPQDDDGFPIWPEYETEDEAWAAGAMTAQDYLTVKFPEVPDAKLCNVRDEKMLKDALDIDLACATCSSWDECSLPKGYKAGGSRPIAMLKSEGIVMGYGGCIRCHKRKQSDLAFERRVRSAGFSPNGVKRTFEAFRHEGASADVIVAKARAILALKNRTNLILGGRTGTGKTHLATAIALEAMKAGRNVLFRSMPELLDEICRARKEHNDAFTLMMKYASVSCLVLDDWGKETTSDARLSYLYHILNHRYENGLQTIITTNARNAEELKNKFNEDKIDPLVSRVLGNGEWVNILEGEDYRLKHRAEVALESDEYTMAEFERWQTEHPALDEAEPISEKLPESDEDRAIEELTEAYADNLCDNICSDEELAEIDRMIDEEQVRTGGFVSVAEALGAMSKPEPEPEPKVDRAAELAAIQERIEHPLDFETGKYVPLPYSDVSDRMTFGEYVRFMDKRKVEYEKAKAEYDAAHAPAEAHAPADPNPPAEVNSLIAERDRILKILLEGIQEEKARREAAEAQQTAKPEQSVQLLIPFEEEDEAEPQPEAKPEVNKASTEVAKPSVWEDDDDDDGGLDEWTLNNLYGGLYSD